MPKLCCKVLSNFRQAEIFPFKLCHLVIFSVISDFHSLWWYVCSSISHVNDLSRYERTFSKRNIVAYCAFVSLYHTATQFLKPMHVWKLNSSVLCSELDFEIDAAKIFFNVVLGVLEWAFFFVCSFFWKETFSCFPSSGLSKVPRDLILSLPLLKWSGVWFRLTSIAWFSYTDFHLRWY